MNVFFPPSPGTPVFLMYIQYVSNIEIVPVSIIGIASNSIIVRHPALVYVYLVHWNNNAFNGAEQI